MHALLKVTKFRRSLQMKKVGEVLEKWNGSATPKSAWKKQNSKTKENDCIKQQIYGTKEFIVFF